MDEPAKWALLGVYSNAFSETWVFLPIRLSDLSEEELEALEKQVDAEVKVQGGRSKPTIRDTLGFQLLLLPINAYKVNLTAIHSYPF